jgi:uncharacterized protein (DUF885 family)
MKYIQFCLLLFFVACKEPVQKTTINEDANFSAFEARFLDHYWEQYPSSAIQIGYGKYYENLVVPDSISFAANVRFSKQCIDSLNTLNFNSLSDNNKISFNIIKNQLESDIWYQSEFNSQQWDASTYNLSNECYYIIHQPYAPLDERLRTLSNRLKNADRYYLAAYRMLNQPTRESVGLSVMQNQGGLSIFGKDLTDSIKTSHLTASETDTLNVNIAKAVNSIRSFVDSLNAVLANKNYVFRKFSIGKDLYTAKFKYDLATNFTPEEIYNKALTDKKMVTERMAGTAGALWNKYFQNKPKPKENIVLIQTVIDAISLRHARAEDFFDSLRNQVVDLKKFIIEKDLFAFDTAYPIVVRLMPEYERGVAIASA